MLSSVSEEPELDQVFPRSVATSGACDAEACGDVVVNADGAARMLSIVMSKRLCMIHASKVST